MSARAERRAMIALLAVFALLVQALIPGMAAAAPTADPAMVICTEAGPKPAPVGDSAPGRPPADHACQHCLCPALATAAPPTFEAQPVAYVTAEAARAPDAPPPPRRARAPPRPPGQGPPRTDA
jgi:hypothetical protein